MTTVIVGIGALLAGLLVGVFSTLAWHADCLRAFPVQVRGQVARTATATPRQRARWEDAA